MTTILGEDGSSFSDLHVNNSIAELVPGLEKLVNQDDLKFEENEIDDSRESDIEVDTDSSNESCEEQEEVAKVKKSGFQSEICPPCGKRTGSQQKSSVLQVQSESKKSKLSLPSDVNSNQWAAGQIIDNKDREEVDLLESGDDLPSSPIFRSRSKNPQPVPPVAIISTHSSRISLASQPSGDSTNNSPNLGNNATATLSSSSVILEPPQVPIPQPVPPVTSITSGSRTDPGRKTGGKEDFFYSPGKETSVVVKDSNQLLLCTARSLVPVEVALAGTEPRSAWQEVDVKDIMNRNKGKVDRLVGYLVGKMAEVQNISKHGLVHWGGGGRMDWICLGENEVKDKSFTDWREEWVPEGVGRRTRAASRSRFNFEENDEKIVTEENKNLVGDIYDFDDEDANVIKLTRKKVNRKAPLDDDDDFMDDGDSSTNVKPGKGKGGGKGKERGKRLSGGKGRGGRKGNPGLEAYFDSVNKTQDLDKADSYDVIDKSRGIPSVEDEDFQPTASVSPNSALCNRFLAKWGSGSSSTMRTRPERRGTCPMCGMEMGMKELEVHAAQCEGGVG